MKSHRRKSAGTIQSSRSSVSSPLHHLPIPLSIKQMRLVLLPILFFVPLSSLPQDHAPLREDWNLRASQVRHILVSLSERYSIHLRAEAPLNNEVILLKANNVDVKEIMENIAFVLHAQWEREKEGHYVLRRPPSTLQELTRRDNEERESLLKTLLGKIEEQLNSLPDSERWANEALNLLRERLLQPAPQPFSPLAQTLLHKTLWRLGPSVLASLPYHRVVVFSNRPTPAQRALPSNFSDDLHQYVQACKTLLDALPASLEEKWRAHPALKPALQQIRNSLAVTKCLLFVRLELNQLWACLALYDSNGKKIAVAAHFYPLRKDSPVPEFFPKLTRTLITPSPEWQELHRLYPWDPTEPFQEEKGIYPPEGMDRLAEYILTPDKRDPLSFGATDGIWGLAEALGAKVIACLPDSLMEVARSSTSAAGLDLKKFLQGACFHNVEVRYQNEWLLLRPANPLQCERSRVPREALQTLLQSAWAKRQFDFRAFCVFSEKAGSSAWESPVEDYSMRLLESLGTKPLPLPLPPRWLCRLLGSLSDTLWEQLQQGLAVPLTTLSPGQKEYVLAWASEGPSPCVPKSPELSEEIPDLQLTGTECVPLGLPLTTQLVALRHTTDVILNPAPAELTSYDAFFNTPASPKKLAQWAANLISQGVFSSLEEILDREYLFGQQTWLTYQIELVPGIVLESSYPAEISLPRGSSPLRYRDLPASFRQEVEQWLRRFLSPPLREPFPLSPRK
jgi:hypothetical protein